MATNGHKFVGNRKERKSDRTMEIIEESEARGQVRSDRNGLRPAAGLLHVWARDDAGHNRVRRGDHGRSFDVVGGPLPGAGRRDRDGLPDPDPPIFTSFFLNH